MLQWFCHLRPTHPHWESRRHAFHQDGDTLICEGNPGILGELPSTAKEKVGVFTKQTVESTAFRIVWPTQTCGRPGDHGVPRTKMD